MSFVPTFNASNGKFSVSALDLKGADSGVQDITMTLDGAARLPRLSLRFLDAQRKTEAAAPTLGNLSSAIPDCGPCYAVRASHPTQLEVTAGVVTVVVNKKGKVKTFGAPFGVYLDILPPGAAPDTAAEPACHIRVPGAIKPGQAALRKVSIRKVTGCFAALQLTDCAPPMTGRAQAISGKRFKSGAWSSPVPFTPECQACP